MDYIKVSNISMLIAVHILVMLGITCLIEMYNIAKLKAGMLLKHKNGK